VNEQWSVGVGPDFNYFGIDTKAIAHLQTLPDGTLVNGVSRSKADDWTLGAHIGVLYRLNETTRIGLNYRSQFIMQLGGFSDLSVPEGSLFTSARTNSFNLRVSLPPSTTLSIYHDMTPCWALMGTLAYDQWSVLRNYYATNYQSLVVIPSTYIPQYMRNTIDVGIGTHYKLNQQWMLRANIKYEPTPTKNAYRDVNFPDGDKLGVQIGARYQVSNKVALDLMYGHVFVRTVPIHLTQPVTFVTVNGHNRTSVDLFGAQLVWSV
jgi:long-chain fatty acid transport protein